MSDAELLAIAVEFNLGPPPLLNGRLLHPTHPDALARQVRVVQRINRVTSQVKWAIHDGLFCDLNKSGHWETALSGSATRKDYLARCRYDTVAEAVELYGRWKSAVLAWATKKLARVEPDMHYKTVLSLPRRFTF